MTTTERAVCLWLTGLSASGKSTIAYALQGLLAASGYRAAVLDGDEVRATQCRDLDFSKADRDMNVMRVAQLAREIVDGGQIAICALISPYRSTRAAARQLIGSDRFVEVFVDTPLAVCESRDPKGLYARARRGEIVSFTGVDDPYEPPVCANVLVETAACSALENAEQVRDWLLRHWR